jgi:hypothetical protein
MVLSSHLALRTSDVSVYLSKTNSKVQNQDTIGMIDDGCPAAAGLLVGLLDSFVPVSALSYDIVKWAMMGETRPHCTIDHLISSPQGPYWRLLDGRDPSEALKDVLLEPWPRCSTT